MRVREAPLTALRAAEFLTWPWDLVVIVVNLGTPCCPMGETEKKEAGTVGLVEATAIEGTEMG